MGLVIDTHILIWYLAEPNKLSQKAINAIDENLKQTGGIIIPINSPLVSKDSILRKFDLEVIW